MTSYSKNIERSNNEPSPYISNPCLFLPAMGNHHVVFHAVGRVCLRFAAYSSGCTPQSSYAICNRSNLSSH